MKLKITVSFLLLSFLIVLSCISHKNTTINKRMVIESPVGTVQIDSNLFIDKTEIRNLDYLEYLFWTKRIFGITSLTYKNALPDTTVWEDAVGYLKKDYLRSPFYYDYPVVGVSYRQAMDFSVWRSNRVFQFIMASKKILSLNKKEDSTNYFTIERYFKGQYFDYKPDLSILYPEYNLPCKAEWNFILLKADSVNNKKVYTVPVKSDSKNQIIFHLNDNVSEISRDAGFSLGNNWNLTKDIRGSVVNDFDKPNSWTGFRNVCRWKKYNAS